MIHSRRLATACALLVPAMFAGCAGSDPWNMTGRAPDAPSAVHRPHSDPVRSARAAAMSKAEAELIAAMLAAMKTSNSKRRQPIRQALRPQKALDFACDNN